MEIKIVKKPIKLSEVIAIANAEFGDVIKAVIDIEQKIMALGGELHADEEVLLSEREASKRANTWGINIYPNKSRDIWIEFDSMVNLKPAYGNRSRGVEDKAIQEKIVHIVDSLIEE